jgi:hypothetical protein
MTKYEVYTDAGRNVRRCSEVEGQSIQIKDGDLAIWAHGSIQAAYGAGHWLSVVKQPEEPEREVITP